MERWNKLLNTVMGGFVGVFLGHCIYVVSDYMANPGLYAMGSAPWYGSLLVSGGLTLVLVLVCLGLKAALNRKK